MVSCDSSVRLIIFFNGEVLLIFFFDSVKGIVDVVYVINEGMDFFFFIYKNIYMCNCFMRYDMI